MSVEQRLIIQTYLFFYASEKRDIITPELIFAVCMTMFSGYCSYLLEFQHGKPFFQQEFVHVKRNSALYFFITILFGKEKKWLNKSERNLS